MNTKQLEMTFETSRRLRRQPRSQDRRRRAEWWFARMRLVVDRALDWSATPVARPEQTYLSLVVSRNALGRS